MKQYRTVYNQDCTNLFCTVSSPIEAGDVDRMVDQAADSGVDVLLVNPNAQRVNYPSIVWQTFWDGYTPGDREFFRGVPEEEAGVRELWVGQMKRLADSGCDYLARALGRCRARGIAPGVTVRMNDMHDAPYVGTHMFSRFYLGHPELRLGNDQFCAWGAIGLDYSHQEVRDHYLALIGELISGYDFEVLELDFLRFHCYFPRDNFARHYDIMTGFLREVRSLADSSGRMIALMPRIAAAPAAACELGFDIAAWAAEGLVDGISAGAFMSTQWRIPMADFRAPAGGEVALFACLDYTADRRPGLPARTMPDSPELLRGFAAGHLAAGADGVELFNFPVEAEDARVRYQIRNPDDVEAERFHDALAESVPAPAFDTIRSLGDLDSLRGTAKTYTVLSGWRVAETDGAVQVPAVAERGRVLSFRMLLAAEPDGTEIEAAVTFTGGAATAAQQLWMQVNHTPCGHARSIAPMSGASDEVRQAVFRVPAAAIRDGDNEIVLRNEGGGPSEPYSSGPAPPDVERWADLGALTVISVDVRVLG